MAIKRVMVSVALVVLAAAEVAANASSWADQSVSLRGSSMVDSFSSAATGCTASWAYNCNSNPTCCEAGFTCYQKTPSWAACLKTCTPGIVQPGDDGKQIPWTCAVIEGGGQDPTPPPGTDPSPPASDPTPPPGTDPSPPEESCTASWAYNCNSNPTCCEAGFTCYQKTPSWAACLKTCTPGIVQPGDDGKQIPWTCAVIGGGGQDPAPAPSPSTPAPAPSPGQECADKDEQCGAWAAGGECSANPDYMHQFCRLSCSLCQP